MTLPRVVDALVVEDDGPTRQGIAAQLEGLGWSVLQSDDGLDGLQLALCRTFDLITVDRMLPGLDGLELTKRLREAGCDTPILMVSALSDVDERVIGLRAGGDDYLTKPFAPEELIARAEVLIRRRSRERVGATVLRIGDLELDLLRHVARRGSRLIELQPMEYKLLEFLCRNAGQALSRRIIFEKVWGYTFDPGANLINVHVSRLRRKLEQEGEPPMIETVRGSGYRLNG